MDYNILIALAVTIGLVLFLIFIKPLNFGYYREIKLSLMIMQKSFRTDKVVAIADILMTVVTKLEELEVSNEEKQAYAVQLASKEILEKLGIVLDEDVLSLIVDIAVSYIPPTHK